MDQKIRIIADDKIPFLRGRMESVADVSYVSPDAITREMVKNADALIVRTRTRCGAELLQGSSVGLVATATIGMDHIDLGWCRDNGIAVRNAAGCNAPGVAQYVWSVLLRNGFDPRKDTLGVVGYGNIGSIVADWGNRLGCRVLVCDPPRKRAGYSDVRYLSLSQVLNEADAVTFHIPLTRDCEDATFHLVGRRELDMLKRGAIVINAARGEVVDNAAWKLHLKEGKTKAIIDTWEWEPNIDLELMRLATVATPHIAGYSLEGKQRATRMAIEAVEEYFGVECDKSGLEGAYSGGDGISMERICASYNPFVDTDNLRRTPDDFEGLRGRYDYRREP